MRWKRSEAEGRSFRKTPQAVATHSLSMWSTKPRKGARPPGRGDESSRLPDRCEPRCPASPPPTWRRRQSRPATGRYRPPGRFSGSTLAAIAALHGAGQEICGVISVLDRLAGGGAAIERESGAPYVALTTIDDIYPDRPDRPDRPGSSSA